MARTVRTIERHASRSPSSEGNNSHADGGGQSDTDDNGNSFCNKDDHQKKMSSTSRTSSATPQSSYNIAMQTTAPQTIRNRSSRFDDGADYMRASTTVARMPPPSSSSSSYSRNNNYSREYYSEEDQRRNNNDRDNMSYYKHPQCDWNSSSRGRGGWDSSHYCDRGGRGGRGQFHYSSRQQYYNNSHPSYYDDDGKWGRERGRGGWNNNNNSRGYNNSTRPRNQYSKRYQSTTRPPFPSKRQKYSNHHPNKRDGHNINNNRDGHNVNNNNNGRNDNNMVKLKKDIEERMEKRIIARLKREMEDQNLLLKKEMEDLKKKSSVVVQVVPPHPNIQQPLVSVPGIIDNDNAPNGAIMQRQQQNSAHANTSSNLGMQSSDNTSPMAIGSSFNNVVQQRHRGDINVGTRVATISNNCAVQEQHGDQPARLCADTTTTSQARTLNDDHDSCYDLSTDDDIDFPSVSRKEDEKRTDDEINVSPINRQDNEGRNESDNTQHDDTTNQLVNGTTSPGNNDVDFGGSDGAWSGADTNHQGNNGADGDEEVESTNNTLRDPENNSNNDTENNTSSQSNNSDNINGYESDADSVDPVLRDDYEVFDGTLAFCCLNCRCWETSESKFLKLSGIRNSCGNSSGGVVGNTKLYHRGCCHGDKDTDVNYLSAMTRAIYESTDGEKKKQQMTRSEAYEQIKRSYNTAKKEETRFENEECYEDNMCSNHSNPAYSEYCKIFQQRTTKTRQSPLRVLDLFSGIGSGTVVLKRLGLPIETIVHVEHDPVAVEVIKYNHHGDGINHQYVETFEDIYGTSDKPDDERIKAMVDKFGSIDVVLSGAPCQNYSGLNASRDQTSANAQYLKKVGWLCKKLDEIQKESKNDNVLFLSENVVFKTRDEINCCYTDDGNGLTPICVDARDFGPVKRNRLYWMNIPVKSSAHIKEVAFAVSVDTLLDDGYGAVARLVAGGDDDITVVKANAFLASNSRIDDNRMVKYKKKSDNAAIPNSRTKYEIETYSVGEREKMMGLPEGYVEKPLRELFQELAQNAFLRPETEEGKTYRDYLPKELWHFRKKCQFKFKTNFEPPYFQLALSSPLEGRKELPFYNEREYCKHLIGNGWSLPVVEHMLGSLKDLFPEDMLTEYDGYTYKYQWEPYLSM